MKSNGLKKDKYYSSHLYEESNTQTPRKRGMDWWFQEVGFAGWVGENCEGGQKVYTSSYKISSRDVMFSIVIIGNNTVLYI